MCEDAVTIDLWKLVKERIQVQHGCSDVDLAISAASMSG